MKKWRTVKTLLLGLAAVLITCSLFVALPALISPLDQINSDILMWACSMRGKPVIYDNWFWHSNEQPDLATIEKSAREVVTTEGILFGLKKSFLYGGLGTLDISIHPEHENLVVVSGYLQYGSYAESETDTDTLSIPIPVMMGTLGRRLIRVTLTDIYENAKIETEKVLLTDDDGFFSVTFEPDIDSTCFRIEAAFEEEINIPADPKAPITTYRGSRVTYTTCGEDVQFEKRGIPWWVWVVSGTGAIVVLIVLFRYFLKKRLKFISDTTALPPSEEVTTAKPVMKKIEEAEGDVSEVSIRFPDIEEFLPPVREANETWQVQVTFKDRYGRELALMSGNVDFGDGDSIRVTTDEKGSSLVSHVYSIKGDYTITAGYQDRTGRDVSSWRRIRIVDYREEMVRLFGEMLEKLNLADISIGADMTPREVERLLFEKLEGVSKENVRRVIEGFEEANYSTHPVNRESYVRMYRALQEIVRRDD